MILVRYYEFISVTHGCRVRIIVKRVGDGPAYFWSIIPYWKQTAYGNKMSEGNPEID